ncbi:MAG: amidohydrolase family protein [Pseudonocardiaceae bacterium]|nr:amidohydrolase family protein [Pseudonocardiaceae bacterium]
MADRVVDVHQHLWPESFIAALRARTRPPMLDGWTLRLSGEPPFEVDPADHDVAKRQAREADGGADVVLVSLSSPLGIEWLAPDEAEPLLDAWHRGALELPDRFQVWAAAGVAEPDAAPVADALERGCVGLQLPADAIGSPGDLERVAPLLDACEQRSRPVLVHPGRASCPTEGVPGWWVPVVDYVAQLQAAWWSWHAAGRALFPRLRICFAAGAGLAPLHYERLVARGGVFDRIDPDVFVDTSSYGTRALDALIRVLGIDPVVLGSDRPYAEPTDPGLGVAATRAIRCANPRRLLEGGSP